MSKRDDDLLVDDVLDSCNKIFEYTQNDNYESFVNNSMIVDAVVRNFEVIGEASKLISEKIKLTFPLVEWQLMTDFRNVLIHEYFGIDYEILWNTIQNELKYNYEMIKLIKL